MWLRSKPKTLFADGIRRLVNLVNRYAICVEKRGAYVEE
jgi:hypothetical protein